MFFMYQNERKKILSIGTDILCSVQKLRKSPNPCEKFLLRTLMIAIDMSELVRQLPSFVYVKKGYYKPISQFIQGNYTGRVGLDWDVVLHIQMRKEISTQSHVLKVIRVLSLLLF